MASTVAESRPPDSSTMARTLAVTSLARHIAPQNFVKLHLKTYGYAIRQNPIRQHGRRKLRVAGREKNAAAFRQAMPAHELFAPVIVRARADHEFELVARREIPEVLNTIARSLIGGRRLDIDHA